MKSNCPQCLNNQNFHITTQVSWYIFYDEYNCRECVWVGEEEDLISKEHALRELRKYKIKEINGNT